MNTLDKKYTDLLQDILDNGTKKQDRTGTGTISVFGRQIRHKMSEGFPLLTTKKMYFKGIVTELLWFLRGDTNIKFLVDNDCHIWDGDALKAYHKHEKEELDKFTKNNPDAEVEFQFISKEEFINKIKTDDEFAKKWGELGPIYGKQWRSWKSKAWIPLSYLDENNKLTINGSESLNGGMARKIVTNYTEIDQIANLINDLKTNPDSRRLMVSAWNVGELDQMVLPPCHYGFQVYTRELSESERFNWYGNKIGSHMHHDHIEQEMDENNVPKRAISLMWNQRSVDTPLGLPFNIASYGLLLEIIAKAVNMVPDELIGNLGDCHIYSNQVDGVKEQIGRELTLEERRAMVTQGLFNQLYDQGTPDCLTHSEIDRFDIPRFKIREPYPLPTLNINTEFWQTESGECGEGPIDAMAVVKGFSDDNFCKCLLEEDIQLANYQSHPKITMPLSN